jgi:hypothetical protein
LTKPLAQVFFVISYSNHIPTTRDFKGTKYLPLLSHPHKP